MDDGPGGGDTLDSNDLNVSDSLGMHDMDGEMEADVDQALEENIDEDDDEEEDTSDVVNNSGFSGGGGALDGYVFWVLNIFYAWFHVKIFEHL